MFYNASKDATDPFDGMCANLSCARKTRRWALCIFYILLNIVMNKSWILYAARPRQQRIYKTRLTSSLIWLIIFLGLGLLRNINE